MNKYEINIYKYIKKNIHYGFKEDKIKEKLIGAGHDKEVVDNVFLNFNKRKGPLFKRIFPKKIRVELTKEPELEKPVIEKKEDINPVYKPIEKEVIKHSTGGLVSKLNELNEKVDAIVQINQEQTHKKFALPNKIKSQLKKLAEKNKVLILLLRRNRSIEPMITDVKNGFVIINGIPRNCSLDFVFLWKGQNLPCMVVKDWDLEPVGTKDYYEAVKLNRVADPMPTAIRMMEEMVHMEKGGMQLSPKIWIFIGLGVIALIWILFGGGF
jgi:hypothetical protein